MIKENIKRIHEFSKRQWQFLSLHNPCKDYKPFFKQSTGDIALYIYLIKKHNQPLFSTFAGFLKNDINDEEILYEKFKKEFNEIDNIKYYLDVARKVKRYEIKQLRGAK